MLRVSFFVYRPRNSRIPVCVWVTDSSIPYRWLFSTLLYFAKIQGNWFQEMYFGKMSLPTQPRVRMYDRCKARLSHEQRKHIRCCNFHENDTNPWNSQNIEELKITTYTIENFNSSANLWVIFAHRKHGLYTCSIICYNLYNVHVHMCMKLY